MSLPRTLLVLALAAPLLVHASLAAAQGRVAIDRNDEAYKDALQQADLSPQAQEWVNEAIRGFSAARMRAGFVRRADLEESAILTAFEEEVMPRLALEGIGGETRASMLGTILDRLTLARERLDALDQAQARFKAAVVAAVSDPTAQGRLLYDAIDRLQARGVDLWRDAAAEPGAAKGADQIADGDEPWMPPALPRLVAAELGELYAAAGAPEDGARREALDETAARLAQATADWLTLALQGA